MNKETNMEHFRSKIEAVMEKAGFGMFNGEIARCGDCPACSFSGWQNDDTARCEERKIKWLMSEYKPEPVLTAREKHFVEFVQEGWLARDSDGELWWYKEKPKRGNNRWKDGGSKYSFCGILVFDQHFRFITWEDEEPWSIADLRKLKALEYNPEDVAFKKGGVSNE